MIDGELRARVWASTTVEPVILFGSWARRDARSDSDIDVIQVVARPMGPTTLSGLSVARYTIDHLLSLAKEGSLFLLHVVREAVALNDGGADVLRVLRSSFRLPSTYSAYRNLLAVLCQAFDVSADEFSRYGDGLCKLLRFVARSYVYSLMADRIRPPCFSLAACLGMPELPEARMIHADVFSGVLGFDAFCRESRLLAGLLGGRVVNSHGNLEGLLVAVDEGSIVEVFLKRIIAGRFSDPYEEIEADVDWVE